MIPALSHVEQSRNTLFATSAKEVTCTAKVNMVVENKQLVKQLQDEVARLEAVLQSPEIASSSCLKSLLREKERKIQQMEINELKRQRDLAQSMLELERSSHKEPKASKNQGFSSQVVKRLSFNTENDSISGKYDTKNKLRKQGKKDVLVNEIRNLETRQRQLGEEANCALELLHKEVASQRLVSEDTAESIAKFLSESKLMHAASCNSEVQTKDNATLREEIDRLNSKESDITILEEKLETVQRFIEKLVARLPTCEETPDSKASTKKKKGLPFTLSSTANIPNITRSPCPTMSSQNLMESEDKNRAPENNYGVSCDDSMLRQKSATSDSEKTCSISSRGDFSTPKKSVSINVKKKMQKMFKKATEDNIQSIKAYVTELKERVAKLQYNKQLLVCQVLELEEANDSDDAEIIADESSIPLNVMFEDQRK